MKFTVPGNPVGKERPRKGRYGNFYTPPKTKTYEARVREYFFEACHSQGFEYPAISVQVMCYFGSGQHPDPDNVLKSCLDSLQDKRLHKGVYQNVAYRNDRSIASSVDFRLDPANPRVEIELQ
jgi:Holliday junction resolvase RusA-like endonuclease